MDLAGDSGMLSHPAGMDSGRSNYGFDVIGSGPLDCSSVVRVRTSLWIVNGS